MMTTYFFLGLLALSVLIAIAFYNAEGVGYVLAIVGSIAAIFLYCLIWDVESNYKTYEKIKTDSCEISRTESTVFVKCGDLQTTTKRHYVYENLGNKSENVNIYRTKDKDVYGTQDVYLTFKRK